MSTDYYIRRLAICDANGLGSAALRAIVSEARDDDEISVGEYGGIYKYADGVASTMEWDGGFWDEPLREWWDM